MYTFVNKNFLIPIVETNLSKKIALNKLYQDTIYRTTKYNNDVYVIYEDCDNEQNTQIYYSDGTQIFNKNIYLDTPTNVNIVNSFSHYSHMEKNYLINNITESTDLQISDNMNISIKKSLDKSNNKKILEKNIIPTPKPTNSELNNPKPNEINEIEEPNENDKKKEQLIQLIEQSNELYYKELFNIKQLEINLKNFDLKLNKLVKKKKENIVNNIIKTQSEYQTWKKLKYKMTNDDDIFKPIEELELSYKEAPILFLSKFNYIDKIMENDGIRNFFNNVNLINLNDLYSNGNLPNESIIQFCAKYVKLSKELHYSFDNEWNYLENEMNVNSTNKLIN